MSVWYHGGYPGLAAGDLLNPPDITGTNHRLSRYTPAGAAHGNRTDVVYITRHQPAARAFAAFYPDGALYRVEPHGDMRPDPDAPSSAAMCEWAIVLDIVHPRVVFAHRTPQSWLRMMQEVQP